MVDDSDDTKKLSDEELGGDAISRRAYRVLEDAARSERREDFHSDFGTSQTPDPDEPFFPDG